jgi:hypothetical protein
MTILAAVEASGVYFIWYCILSGWGSLSTLFPNVWSMKNIGAWNHLLLRGNQSLSSGLRLRLKTLSDGAEDRSGRQRFDVDAGPRVGALLTLVLLLALA